MPRLRVSAPAELAVPYMLDRAATHSRHAATLATAAQYADRPLPRVAGLAAAHSLAAERMTDAALASLTSR